MFLAAPLFTLLDRPTGESTAGLEASYVEFGHAGYDAEGSRGEMHVEIVDPGTGLGGYVRAPIAHMYQSGITYGYSGTAFDDVEAGGVLRVHCPHELDVVLHAGVALSTASNDLDPVALTYTAGARAQDFVLSLPHGNSARFGVSPRWRSGSLIAGADLGVDLNDSNYQMTAQGTKSDVYESIVHVDAGVGYANPHVVVTAEITSARVQPGYMNPAGWIVTSALALRFPVGRAAPYAALLLPLEDSVHYNQLTLGATAGVDVSLF